MEIIFKGNKHKEPNPERAYGCVCANCNSAFVFYEHEISRPRMPFATDKDCAINCPVCNTVITLDKCTKFDNDSEEIEFKLAHTPAEKENN